MNHQPSFKNVRDNALSAGAAAGFTFNIFGQPWVTLIATLVGVGAGIFYAESHNRKISNGKSQDIQLEKK